MSKVQILTNGAWLDLAGLQDVRAGDKFRVQERLEVLGTWGKTREAKGDAQRKPHPMSPTNFVWCVDSLYEPIPKNS
jgi:hypothetical protein